MDNPGYLHIPTTIALGDPRLFWLLLHELYKLGHERECDHLMDMDWSEWANSDEGEDLASQTAKLFFAKDDLSRLQTLSEGFSTDRHALYFRRLRENGKTMPQSKACLAWMQSQSLIGKGFEGFKAALSEGNVELAKSLHQPTAAEAESSFYELSPQLTKESLGFLLFLCPSLASMGPLSHAVHAKAPEDALCFLAWKIEESHPKSSLRHPDGDDKLLGSLLFAAASRRQFALAKKLLEWDHSLAFDKHEPMEIAPPWDNDFTPIKLDGSLALTPADFACLYAHDGFARALAHFQSPPPNLPKILVVIAALGKKLESRQKGQGTSWTQDRLAKAESIAKDVWRAP